MIKSHCQNDQKLLQEYDLVNPYREKRETVLRAAIMKSTKEHDTDDWERNYILMNMYMPKTYEMLEKEYHLTFAMALYMAEHIKQTSELHKLTVDCDLADVVMPSCRLIAHSEEVKSALYIIQHRNDDLGENDRFLLNPYSVKKKVPEVPSRARFHKLMALVGHQDEAKAYYEQKREAWRETFFKALGTFIEKLGSFHETYDDEVYGNDFDPIAQYDFFSDFLYPNLSYQTREERKAQSLSLHQAYAFLPKAFGVTTDRTLFALGKSSENKEAQALMDAYQVEDPYLLAYGLLVFLDERDDALFIYGENTKMLEKACQRFAWNFPEDIAQSSFVKAADYFQKICRYKEKDYGVDGLIYELSDVVLPLSLKQVKSPFRLRARDQGFVDGFMTALHQSPIHQGDTNDQVTEALVYQERENKKLRQEVEQLKKESHLYSTKNTGYREEYEAIKKQYEDLKEETAKLREIIFHQSEEDLPEEKLTIPLPYRVKERVLIYGGHQSWQKNIKSLFTGEIEFMLSGQKPSQDYLRRFDVIFLQTGGMGHADYYYLINIIRRYNLNLRYFTMSGVKACAKELYDYEER